MSGTNPSPNWTPSFSTGPSVMTSTVYKGAIDACFQVAARFSDAFYVHQAASPAMSVVVDAGFLTGVSPTGLQSITEVAQQTVTITTAPTSPNKRIDLIVVNDSTGVATAIAGTPASSPSAPAITAGTKQLAQVFVGSSVTSILATNVTDLRAVFHSNVPGVKWAIAGGSADAITAAYTPANGSLVDGLILGFRATAANATTTPTFNADGLGAKTVTKKGGAALLVGDIPGALAECLVRYNLANTRWELLNPASALPLIPNHELLANTSGGSAVPIGTTLTALIDDAIGSTRGAILERGSGGWALLAPGTSGNVLTSNGGSADPSYQAIPNPLPAAGAIGSYALTYNGSSPGPGTWQTNSNIPAGATEIFPCCADQLTSASLQLLLRIA